MTLHLLRCIEHYIFSQHFEWHLCYYYILSPMDYRDQILIHLIHKPPQNLLKDLNRPDLLLHLLHLILVLLWSFQFQHHSIHRNVLNIHYSQHILLSYVILLFQQKVWLYIRYLYVLSANWRCYTHFSKIRTPCDDWGGGVLICV